MKITELAIYPIKSTRQVSLQQAQIVATGFAHDRTWVLADNEGRFITQRDYPQLVRVLATPQSEGLLLQCPDLSELWVPTPAQGNLCSVSVWKDQCDALDAGDEAALWFSQFLNTSCRLYYQPENAVRAVDSRFAKEGDRTGFADGFPFLLTTEGSLAQLNRRLHSPVPMKRFRPNIVVDSTDAFAEDSWKKIQIGEVIFRVAKPCSRCVMTTVDTETGTKTGKDPLATLAKYRKSEGGIIFGQNLIHDHPGVIRVGDPVIILE